MSHALPLYSPRVIAPLPVAHIPAVTDADYLAFLLAFPHYVFSFLLRSRAATANFAIRLSSVAESLVALAFPPLLAISAISASDNLFARALPPREPSACACGFGFFRPIPAIIVLGAMHVKRKGTSLLFLRQPF